MTNRKNERKNEKLRNIIKKLKKNKKQARIIVFRNGEIIVLTENSEEKK